MKEIHDYQVVTADSAEVLETLVKGELKSGWQPVGSHQAVAGSYETVDSSFVLWSQTMVIYGPEMS